MEGRLGRKVSRKSSRKKIKAVGFMQKLRYLFFSQLNIFL